MRSNRSECGPEPMQATYVYNGEETHSMQGTDGISLRHPTTDPGLGGAADNLGTGLALTYRFYSTSTPPPH